MKKLLQLFLFCISFFAISQDIKRENINGKLIIEDHDIEGITVYNSSSNLGTVTNENGEFTIDVASNDLLEIRALQYQNFEVRVSKAVLKSKKISVFLIEEINKLDEVIINSKGLTGQIKIDVKSVKIFNPKLDAIYFGMKNNDTYAFSDDNRSQIESIGLHSQSRTMVNGLNIVNVVDQLLIPLFRSEVKDKNAAGVPEVPERAIKYYFGSLFLVENFNIPEHRIEEFIRYVEDKTFDFDLLNYGHEIEFLEVLSKKSKTFLDTKSDTK
tara:strand:- start:151 stop:960 length:810 start_codon:yes stop_codon:yes gene_type:complete